MKNHHHLLSIVAAAVATLMATEAAQAKLVYVSSTVITSAQDGTSPARAFKSIAQVNAASNSGAIAAGDTVLFRCGAVWPPEGQQPVTLVAKAGVTYSAYNWWSSAEVTACENGVSKPTLMGSADLKVLTPTGTATWQADSSIPGVSGVYSLQLSNAVDDITQLTDGGSELRYTRARHPNAGAGQYGVNSNYNKLAEIPGVTPPTSLVVAGNPQTYTQALLGNAYAQNQPLSGATAFVKVRDYDVCSYEVTGASAVAGGTLIDVAVKDQCAEYIFENSIHPPGGGYWLENKSWMLDLAGEWYFDKLSKKLYFKPISGSPSSTLRASAKIVGAAQGQYVVDASAMNGANDQIVFKNLKIADSIADGVVLAKYSSGSLNFTLDGVDIINAGRDAVRVGVGDDVSVSSRSNIKNGTIKNAARNGISSWGTFINVENNIIDKPGRVGIALRNGNQGIPIDSWGSIVKQNKITNAFSSAIQFDALAKVTQNTVTNSCMGSDDCGAIYTYGPFKPDWNGVLYAEVSRNMVDTVPVVNDGMVPTSGNLRNGGIGIYLDGGASAVVVSDNTVKNAGTAGILLNQGGASNTVNANTVYGSGSAALVFAGEAPNPFGAVIQNNMVIGNTFVANKVRTRLIDHKVQGLVNNAGTPESPSYVAPIKYENNRYYAVEPRPFQLTSRTSSGDITEMFGYHGWYHLGDNQPVAGLFSNDGAGSVSLESIRNNLTAYAKTTSIDLGPINEPGWQPDADPILQVTPESNVSNCLKNGCASISPSSSATSPVVDQVFSTGGLFSIQTSKKYLLVFSAKSSTGTIGEYVFPVLREMAAGGDGVSRPTQYAVGSIQWGGQYMTPLSQEWKTYVMPLDILMNANQARLEFSVAVKDKVLLDEVHLYEVTEDRDPNVNALWIQSNPSASSITATCPPAPASCSGYNNLRTSASLTSTTSVAPWSTSVFVSGATSWQDDDWDGIANKSEAAGCNTPGTDVNVGKVKENGCRAESN